MQDSLRASVIFAREYLCDVKISPDQVGSRRQQACSRRQQACSRTVELRRSFFCNASNGLLLACLAC